MVSGKYVISLMAIHLLIIWNTSRSSNSLVIYYTFYTKGKNKTYFKTTLLRSFPDIILRQKTDSEL